MRISSRTDVSALCWQLHQSGPEVSTFGIKIYLRSDEPSVLAITFLVQAVVSCRSPVCTRYAGLTRHVWLFLQKEPRDCGEPRGSPFRSL